MAVVELLVTNNVFPFRANPPFVRVRMPETVTFLFICTRSVVFALFTVILLKLVDDVPEIICGCEGLAPVKVTVRPPPPDVNVPLLVQLPPTLMLLIWGDEASRVALVLMITSRLTLGAHAPPAPVTIGVELPSPIVNEPAIETAVLVKAKVIPLRKQVRFP